MIIFSIGIVLPSDDVHSLIKISKSGKNNEEILTGLISLKIIHGGSIEIQWAKGCRCNSVTPISPLNRC